MVSGCRTFSFYAQAIKGQYYILAHRQEVRKLLADPRTPQRLKHRLEVMENLRSFAAEKLRLPVDGHYLKYVDVHRPFVVWNVEAAPEFSMQPATWWYPLVGSLEYRGYFSWPGATNYAAYFRRKGYDVAVAGVQAYSTLGWFKDPVLNTFLFDPDGELAETLFHELAHQQVFAHSDTDFNEAFATTVGQEGARRWLQSRGDATGLQDYLDHLRRNDDFVHLVMKTRLRLETLFGDERTEDGKVKAGRGKRKDPGDGLHQQKQRIYAEFQKQLAALKVSWGGSTEFDDWLARPINNAHLNSVAAYYDLVPGFERLLAANGGDLKKFYGAADRLSHKSKKERRELLKADLTSRHKNDPA